MKFTLKDLLDGLRRWNFWLYYGVRDVGAPFRRTIMGPFLVTLQTIVFVLLFFFVFGDSLGLGKESYVFYLAAGYPLFNMVTASITANYNVFSQNRAIIQNIPFPMSAFVLRASVKIFTQFSFAILSYLILRLFLPSDHSEDWLMAGAGFLMLIPIIVFTTATFGLLGVFLSNTSAIFAAFSRFMLFATPVIWYADSKGGVRGLIATYNPIGHAISIVREPLLGLPPYTNAYFVVAGWIIISAVSFMVLMQLGRAKIVLRL